MQHVNIRQAVKRAYPVITHTHYMLVVHSNGWQRRTLDVVGVGDNRIGTGCSYRSIAGHGREMDRRRETRYQSGTQWGSCRVRCNAKQI